MSNEVMKREENSLGDWSPRSMAEAKEFADMVCKTDFVPKNYRQKPNDTLMAMTFGKEIGLGVMAALQNIAVINGKPSIYGDAALALVKSHPSYEGIQETYDANTASCKCTIRRKGDAPVSQVFSMDDAQRAGLLSKDGPWKTYPRRMLQMRARAWAIRDAFPDVLNGISVGEEAADIPMKNITPDPVPRKENQPTEEKDFALEAEGTIEDTPEAMMEKILKDLDKELKRAIEAGLISEEDKTSTMEKAKGKSTLPVLEAYVRRVVDRLAEASNGAA